MNASVSGTAITLTARALNGSTNFAVTVGGITTDSFHFTGTSFSGTGGTLTGATDPATPGTANLTTPLTTTYLYDALGDLTTVNQLPQTRAYGYDSLGNLTSSKTPESNQVATTFTYKDFGAVATRIDPRGVTTTYVYDPSLNRLSSISYSDGTPGVTYTYGTAPASFNNGALTVVADGSGSTTYTYNSLERIQKAAKLINGTTYNIQYTYNAAGELASLTYPSNRVVNQTYDPIGRLQTIADVNNNYLTITPTTDYNSAGELKHFVYGNTVAADFTYNDHLQVASIRYSKAGTDLISLTYGYGTQNNGQIATVTDNHDSTRTEKFTYDAWQRLATAQAGPDATPTCKYSYDYDRFGNRRNQNLLAGSFGNNTQLAIDPSTNRVTGVGGYDASGNMTNDGAHAYSFDGENRIKNVDSTDGTYTYDADNLRVKKVVGTSTTVYVFSGQKVIAEYVNGALSKEYVYSGSQMLAEITGGTGAVNYRHNDHLSVRVSTDSTGTKLVDQGNLPFGEPWYTSATTTKWRFTTYERDTESGNDYAMERYYTNRFGRFASPDLLGGSPSDPQSLNRYAYTENDPVNMVDPLGLSPAKIIIWKECYPVGGDFTRCDIHYLVIEQTIDDPDPDSSKGRGGCPPTNKACNKESKDPKKQKHGCIGTRVATGVQGVVNIGLGELKTAGAIGVGLLGAGAAPATEGASLFGTLAAGYVAVSAQGQVLSGQAQLYSAVSGDFKTGEQIKQVGDIMSGPISGIITLIATKKPEVAAAVANIESAITLGAGAFNSETVAEKIANGVDAALTFLGVQDASCQ